MRLPKYRLFDYSTPGKGVPKDAPKKKGIALFFDIFQRRFWKMVSLNAIYLLLSIPGFIVLWFIVYALLTLMFGELMLTPEGKAIMEAAEGISIPMQYVNQEMASTVTQIATYLSVLIYALFGGGAVTCGMTYVLRNYTVDTHSWMWSDFKSAYKKYFKKGTIVFVIDLVMIALLAINFWFYGSLASDSIIAYVLQGFMAVVFLVFLLMHAYIYPVLISYSDKKVSRVYKDAFILALGKLPRTFLSMLLCLIVAGTVTFLACFATVYAMLIIPVILFTFVCFVNLFITYPMVQKYLGEYE